MPPVRFCQIEAHEIDHGKGPRDSRLSLAVIRSVNTVNDIKYVVNYQRISNLEELMKCNPSTPVITCYNTSAASYNGERQSSTNSARLFYSSYYLGRKEFPSKELRAPSDCRLILKGRQLCIIH
ncbi:UNVERIFIED_CONTAM: hypothetical protein NCL1_44275 [Trichonephila clavipes]